MSKSIFHRSRRDESPAMPLGAAAVLLTAGAALVLTRKRQTV